METRSSPSLQVLQGLARQAHMGPEDVSSLSKPALFSHLRANYDYSRLERAHQIALKRRDGGSESAGTVSTNSNDEHSVPRSKRPCRAVGPSSGGGGSSSSSSAFSSSSARSPRGTGRDIQQALPPASIFVQTRSRTRMQAAASGPSTTAGAYASRPTTHGVSLAARSRSTVISARITREGRELEEANVLSSSIHSRPRAAIRRGSTQRKTSSKGIGATGKAGGAAGGGSSSSSSGSGVPPRARSAPNAEGATSTSPSSGTTAEGNTGSQVTGASDGDGNERNGVGGTGKRKRQSSVAGTAASSVNSSGRGRGKGKGKGKAKAGSSRSRTRGRDGGSSDPGSSRGVGAGRAACKDDALKQADENRDGDSGAENELDPIMLVKVGKHHYRFVRPNGRVVLYNVESLVDYFISTGDFLEPETRLPFSDDELRMIDNKVQAAGLSKPSVLEAKRDPGRYAQQKFQQDALVGLERMTSELVTGMLRVVEESDREEGEIRLVAELFPPFADLFKQIRAADKSFAAQCMQHYISWLQGPPNRPTEDEMGFLEIILGFLKELLESDGNSPLGF